MQVEGLRGNHAKAFQHWKNSWAEASKEPSTYIESLLSLGAIGFIGKSAPKRTGKWSAESGFFEVGFEAKLTKGKHYPGVSDSRHFQEANKQLHNLFQANPTLAKEMESLYPGIIKGVQPGKRENKGSSLLLT
jgi:hypothetical protein